jgi:hypothetical protein
MWWYVPSEFDNIFVMEAFWIFWLLNEWMNEWAKLEFIGVQMYTLVLPPHNTKVTTTYV